MTTNALPLKLALTDNALLHANVVLSLFVKLSTIKLLASVLQVTPDTVSLDVNHQPTHAIQTLAEPTHYAN